MASMFSNTNSKNLTGVFENSIAKLCNVLDSFAETGEMVLMAVHFLL
jgi:hypothetical protein